MDRGSKILSELVFYRTYPIVLPTGRKETRHETIERVETMHTERFPALADKIRDAFHWVYSGHVRPSMRSFQFAGEPILRENVRMYNCAGQALDSLQKFADFMYILMCGTGQGFSVENNFISNLPKITAGHAQEFIIEDTKESWADSIRILILNPKVVFNYNCIRARGTPLSTGGAASGPDALRLAHERIRGVVTQAIGRQLKDTECADIMCMLAEAVVVGGVRRAALICLFDATSSEMLAYKSGQWWDSAPWRARTNISARLNRLDSDFPDKLKAVLDACFASQTGEPGISLMNDQQWFYNPCHEISLKSFCNLTSVNVAACRNQQEFFSAVQAATLIGVLQKNYTQFHYISKQWQVDCEKEALLGVSFTGLAMGWSFITQTNLLETASAIASETDKIFSSRLGMPPAARIGTIKPSGTESAELGVTSGIHAAHDAFYIRRVRLDRDSGIAQYLIDLVGISEPGGDHLVEKDLTNEGGIVVNLPISQKGALLRTAESATDLLERCKYINKNWIVPTHRYGPNHHNVSVTVNYKAHEQTAIYDWMLANKNHFSGISFLPDDGGTYVQAPFSSISETEFSERLAALPENIDFATIVGRTEHAKDDRLIDWACTGENCEAI